VPDVSHLGGMSMLDDRVLPPDFADHVRAYKSVRRLVAYDMDRVKLARGFPTPQSGVS
jgi:hypothetical protein